MTGRTRRQFVAASAFAAAGGCIGGDANGNSTDEPETPSGAGPNDGSSATRSPDREDGPSGGRDEAATWESRPAMPDERTEVAAAPLENELYVFGGFVPENADDHPVTDDVAVYDPDEEAWRDAAPMPEALHHVAIAASDERIYLLGGHEGDGFDPVDSLHVFDGEGWEPGASMPTPRGAAAAGLIDGRCYVVGGTDGEDALATLEVYDPAADEWEEAAAMPTPREHLTAAVVDGRLYAIGGRARAGNLAVTEVYDPGADEWDEATEMPTARSGLGAAAVEGRIHVVGGESRERTFDETEVYDPESDEWDRLDPMPTARHGLGVAAIDGDIYAASGGPQPGFAYSDVLEVLERP